ncbi:Isochorismatase hydrolase [Penicillium maclennaniae]|uniref:Isochorismatase hydrolase n=1 Tax=Penicillium maclennaniae TaxID=1343394 RepID=UPI002542391B|nr:Isochorismatase hydrolase [Penicillium maclennaniae]KAJ5676569.1 Isochorismatase hydrolase [Penicillium maclennaniae]
MWNVADKSCPGHWGPSQTALLLLDFHSMFVSRLPERGPAAVKVAAEMKTWAKSKGIKVVHALVDFSASPFETCKGSERFAAIAEAVREHGAAECSELLEDADDEVTFLRRLGHVSALKSPGLEDYLKMNNIKSLLLAGLSTSGCVTRTALPACDEEYVVTTISDACADPDDELHRVMLEKVLNNRGYVSSAIDIQKGYEKVISGI